jgi:hypothetical protein
MLMAKTQDHPHTSIAELGGFESAEDGPDVRGWDVIARDGRRIGTVDDVLVETDNREARYLAVRVDDRPDEVLAGEARGPLENAAIPELDSMAEPGELIGQATVPGVTAPERPARTVGEALVRDSLLDVENRMTAGAHPGWNRGERRVLIPLDRAHLESGKRQIRVERLE